jgi:LppP/LprE lipoprotein
MRTRSRSHTSRVVLAALGLLAGLVALSGGAQPTDPADAAPAPDPIRDVDFASVSQPGSACAEGLRVTPPRRIAVARGESALLDLGTLTRLEVDPVVAYGDLDRDGSDEAAVHVVCTFGANGADDSIQVWSVRNGSPSVVDTLSEPPARLAGPLPPAVKKVAISDGEVSVTWTHYDEDDPNCCPSQQTVLRYELRDGALHQVGRAVTTAASVQVNG